MALGRRSGRTVRPASGIRRPYRCADGPKKPRTPTHLPRPVWLTFGSALMSPAQCAGVLRCWGDPMTPGSSIRLYRRAPSRLAKIRRLVTTLFAGHTIKPWDRPVRRTASNFRRAVAAKSWRPTIVMRGAIADARVSFPGHPASRAGYFARQRSATSVFARRSPLAGHTTRWLAARGCPGPRKILTRPFEGLRIIDLGIIVAGGELSRLFA